MRFPDGFLWGAATAAYQIEGAVRAGGRGESIWDRFCHTPGKVKNNDTGDVACDHYGRWEDDLDLMRELGLMSYRFSIAWPRVMPAGAGAVNQAGLDFYRRLTEGLLRRGIRPMATLYHWDLPQALQDQGGWASRDTAARFAEYAGVVFRALGDLVPLWVTHNEPWVVAFLGHALGIHAPGLNDWALALKVAHHVLLSHGMAMEAFRALRRGNSQAGITLNLYSVYPASDRPEDLAAARRMDGFQNRWFLDPIFRGAYPAEMQAYYEQRWGPLDWVRPGDLRLIRAPIDFLGVNYYSAARVAGNPGSAFLELDHLPPVGPVTEMGWEIVPEGLYDLLLRLKRDYGDLPLYITENGAAFPDQVEQGAVHDPRRVEYLHAHLAAAHRAIAAGVSLKGYYAWSLMDNFEWAEGYARRFGLVHVDFATQQRTPKRSALWYREVIRQNGLPG